MKDINLHSKITELRERQGLTQLELSQKIGVTETTIANWENDRSGLECIDRVIKLCKALDCEADQLIEYVQKSSNSSALEEAMELSKITEISTNENQSSLKIVESRKKL